MTIMRGIVSTIALTLMFAAPARADLLDRETYIQRRGLPATRLGEDRRTPFYTVTERTGDARIAGLERSMRPKNALRRSSGRD